MRVFQGCQWHSWSIRKLGSKGKPADSAVPLAVEEGGRNSQAKALSFTTISLPYLAGGLVAVDHSLEFHPAAPEDEPAWLTIPLAVLMAAEARQRVEKLVDGQLGSDFTVSLDAHNFHVFGGHDRRGQTNLRIRLTAGIA